MKYTSTRDPERTTTLSQALVDGLAPDGGLYVPQAMPAMTRVVDAATLEGAAALHELAPRLLAPFFAGDALARSLAAISVEAFDFPAPLAGIQGSPEPLSVLELFHGPTAAFKDFGARFLAACLARLNEPDGRTLTVLVATSGDTGGAVAAAFHGRPGFRVVLLYPEGRVSPIQEQQLTCWGGNVTSLAVQRQLRRLPAPREAGLRAATAARGLRAHLGEQHQHRAPPAAAGAVRIRGAADPGRAGRPRELRHPFRQPRARDGLHLGARDGPADRRDRAGAQCEPDRSGLPRRWTMAAARERRDARLGDGRRRPEQHGAADGALSRTGRTLRAACAPCRSTTRRSAPPSARNSRVRDSRSARTAPRDSRPIGACPRTTGAAATGSWRPRRTRRSSRRPSSRCSGGASSRRRRWRRCSDRPSRKTRIDAEIGALAEQIGEAACTR